MDFRQELVERFHDYTDDELRETAQASTLTDLAQGVIEDELRKRNIVFIVPPGSEQDFSEPADDPSRDPDEEHETVARFANVISAQILRGRLEAEGIPAYVLDANLAIANPFLVIQSGIRVQVPQSFVVRAKELIRLIDDGDMARELDPAHESTQQQVTPQFLDAEAALLAFSQDPVWIQIWRCMIDGKSRFAGFNPFATVLGTTWFFFRKMYGLGIAVLLIDVAVLYFVRLPGAFFVPRILFGFYANVAYYRKAERTIVRVQSEPVDRALAYLKAKGGISPVGALLSIVLGYAALTLLAMLR